MCQNCPCTYNWPCEYCDKLLDAYHIFFQYYIVKEYATMHVCRQNQFLKRYILKCTSSHDPGSKEHNNTQGITLYADASNV